MIGLKNSIINSMIHKTNKDNNDKVDYLNLSNNTWHNPATNQEHQESFVDLFKISLSDLPAWINVVEAAYNNQDYKDKLSKFCANRGYDGVEIGQKMKYHKSVYKRGE
jgi:hypothetical protein